MLDGHQKKLVAAKEISMFLRMDGWMDRRMQEGQTNKQINKS